jgi:hypothetical protein
MSRGEEKEKAMGTKKTEKTERKPKTKATTILTGGTGGQSRMRLTKTLVTPFVTSAFVSKPKPDGKGKLHMRGAVQTHNTQHAADEAFEALTQAAIKAGWTRKGARVDTFTIDNMPSPN